MIKSKEEILNSIKTIIGETPSDEAIALLEDITDTLESSTGGSSDEDKKTIEELQKQLKDNDDEWRRKYTERFFNPSPTPEPENNENNDDTDNEKDSPKTFDELFSQD